jgi:hypothetical protein
MATIASLVVDVAANVARLQTDMNKATNIVQGFAKSAKTILGGIGAYMGGREIWDMANMAMQFEEQKDSLNALAGQYNTTADSIIDSVQKMSKGMISQAQAAGIAGEALMKGLNPEQVSKLAQASETLSNVTGKKVVDIMRDMSQALETGKMKAVKTAIGIVDLDAKYGNLTSTMSETEKAQALYNEVIERTDNLQKQLGDSVESNADKMEKLATQWEDLKLTMGQGFVRVAVGAYGALQWLAAGGLTAFAGIMKLGEGIGWLIEKIPGLSKAGKSMKEFSAEVSANAFGAAGELTGKAVENFSAMVSSVEKAVQAKPIKLEVDVGQANLKKEQDALKASLTSRVKDYEKYYSDLKQMQGEYKSAIEKSLKEIADIDKNILQSRYETQQLLSDIATKGSSMNEMEAYNAKVQKLNNQLTYAMQLSGEDRIKALQDYQRQWSNMVQQIDYTVIERQFKLGEGSFSGAGWSDVEVKKPWLTLGDSTKAASVAVSEAGKLIDQTMIEMRATAETQLNLQIQAFNQLSESVNVADEWVKYLKNTITDLDKGLANPRTLIIDCSAAIAQLQDVLNLANQVAVITGMSTQGTIGGTGAGTSGWRITNPEVLDSFASGTDYVPRTGLYKLHAGEKVTPANQNTTSFGNINITINGGVDDPATAAKKLVAEMEKEMRRRNTLRK